MKFAYLIEPPFNFINCEGHVTGCDVDLARHVFRELGIEEFEPIETEFADLLPGLTDRRWRMTTGLFRTKERCVRACFSRPIWALPDGLLVRRSNPLELSGYASVAHNGMAVLAVIRDQFQHRTAVEFGVTDERIRIFETYTQAAKAVRDGHADAYASVGRAHSAFIEQHSNWDLERLAVSAAEKPPAFGSFAFSLHDTALCGAVDAVLSTYLGSPEHRLKAARYGISDAEVDLVSKTES